VAPSDAIQPFPRILVIDDDAISREVLSMLLEMHGFPVDSVEGGAEALEFLEKNPVFPEVILMDTQMPGLSGVELAKAMRRSTSAPIVAISGSEVSAQIRQATEGFLLKPVEPAALTALLETWEQSPSKTDLTSANGPETKPVPESESSGEMHWIDPVVLGKLKAMMPASSVREIYVAVAADMKARMVTLEAAMQAGNSAEVARIGHTIKGGCSMVGLTAAAEAAARLENGNHRETWQKELLQLHSAQSALQSILESGLP